MSALGAGSSKHEQSQAWRERFLLSGFQVWRPNAPTPSRHKELDAENQTVQSHFFGRWHITLSKLGVHRCMNPIQPTLCRFSRPPSVAVSSQYSARAAAAAARSRTAACLTFPAAALVLYLAAFGLPWRSAGAGLTVRRFTIGIGEICQIPCAWKTHGV